MAKVDKVSDALKRAKRVTWKLRPEILLCSNIPKPMHGVAPREVLGPIWWNAARKAAYKSTAYHCIACGVHKGSAAYRQQLDGHEVYEIDYLLGRMAYVEVVPLCYSCHNFIHSGRLQMLLDEGKITHERYASIVQHGNRVLRNAGLTPSVLYAGPVADWKNWRLVVNGKEYKPKFRTMKAWLKYFGRKR